MRAWGKPVIIGMAVSMKANPKLQGKIIRIYPFERDKPSIMVKWASGLIKTMKIGELIV